MNSQKRRAAILSRWVATAGLSLLLAMTESLGAQAQTSPAGPSAANAPATPLPTKLTALLPKSRQLQHDGDLRAAEEVARFDLKHHTNVSQLAGSLEALTSIYKQSGRFAEALGTGTRYQELLEKIPNADSSKRQDMALLLAEILAGLEKYPDAIARVDDALKIPDGWRATDPLWEPHAYALRAQIERAAGQIDAAGADWREVESRLRSLLDQINRNGPNTDLEEAALKLLTDALVSTDRTPDAIAMREQFLARHQDDQTRARNWSEIARCYAILDQDGQEDRALRAALALETRDETRGKEARSRAEQADLGDRLALVLAHRGDQQQARQQWQEAAAIYQQLLDRRTRHRDDAEQRSGYLAKLEAIFEQLNQWPDAIRVGQQLLKLRSQTWLPDDPKLWRIKLTLGGLYLRASDSEKARPLLADSLVYWRGRNPLATSDLSQTLMQSSKLSVGEGDRHRAIEYAEEAVKVCQQAPAGHELQLAEADDNLADILAAEGHYQGAIGEYQRAVKICRAQPNDRRANILLCGTLVDIAAVYKSQHQYRRAAEYCAQALDIRRQSPGKDAGALIGLYTALATLELAEDQGRPTGKEDSAEVAQAEENIQAARKLCKEQGLLDGPAGIGLLELDAVVDVRRDNPDGARKSLDEALALARRSQQRALEARILTEMTELELLHGSPARAAEQARETLTLDDEIQAHPNLGATAYLNLARANRRLGEREQAIEALGQSIRLVEVPDAAAAGESERAEFRAQIQAATDLWVEWNVADGRLDEALNVVEGANGRNLLGRMRAAGIDLSEPLAGAQAGLHRAEGELLSSFRQRTATLRHVCAKPVVGDETRQLVEQLEELRSQYARTEAEIDEASPIYRNLLGSPHAAHWPELSREILPAGNAALFYYLGYSQSYLFVVDGGTGASKSFPLAVSADLAKSSGLEPGSLTRSTAARLVGDYLKHLRETGARSPETKGPTAVAASRANGANDQSATPAALPVETQLAIAEALLPDAARKWVAKVAPRGLLVVPDGALHQLPLESLLISRRPMTYLDDAFPPISYAPSATVLATLVARRAGATPSPVSLLSVGDPAYPQVDESGHKAPAGTILAEYRALGGQLSPLPGTLHECRSVEQALAAGSPAADRMLLTGNDATESNVRSQIEGRRFVHLATHGWVDQRRGSIFGAIALAAPSSGGGTPKDDGFLTLAEISSLPLSDCELVVLSHCQVKASAGRRLEAGSMLAESLLAAGAGSVVCSQWETEQAATALAVGELFQTVSQQLRAGETPDVARALQKARHQLRKHAEWSAPYFWAPLVYSGPVRSTAEHGKQLSSAR
jgi:CHAT domain-containing protein/tetratricopeptide (TPR) repeat protein